MRRSPRSLSPEQRVRLQMGDGDHSDSPIFRQGHALASRALPRFAARRRRAAHHDVPACLRHAANRQRPSTSVVACQLLDASNVAFAFPQMGSFCAGACMAHSGTSRLARRQTPMGHFGTSPPPPDGTLSPDRASSGILGHRPRTRHACPPLSAGEATAGAHHAPPHKASRARLRKRSRTT